MSLIKLHVLKTNGLSSPCIITVDTSRITRAIFIDQITSHAMIHVLESVTNAVVSIDAAARVYEVSDSLATITSQSSDLVSLPITYRKSPTQVQNFSPPITAVFPLHNLLGSFLNSGTGSQFFYSEGVPGYSTYRTTLHPSSIAPSPTPDPGNRLEIPFSATQNIIKGQAVTGSGAVGNNALVNQRDRIIGIAKADVNIGFIGTAVSDGEMQDSSWTWTIGLPIFLNSTSLSQIAPGTGYSQILGVATGVDKISISLRRAVLL